MLEVLAEFIDLNIMTFLGLYIIKRTLNKAKIIDKKILLIPLFNIIPLFMYQTDYQSIYTLVAFLINIIMYKILFKEDLQKIVVLTVFIMVITMIADLICGLTFMSFMDLKVWRTVWYFRIISNLIINIISIAMYEFLYKIKFVDKLKTSIITKADKSIVTFILLSFLIITIIVYNLYINYKYNSIYLTNIILITIFIVLSYIFIRDRNNYNKLIYDYDNLFNYIQNFEDWIEKEQINRHEYKNQLAALRDVTKEKKTKKKIDEILEDNINIEGNIVNQLKTLPKGGVKGLMYYKLVIAQKNKIDLTVDLSIKKRSKLYKLSEKQVKDLCKLIGIYFDNAIEAAKGAKKKNILIEMYELKDRINIVFSNTFKKNLNFDKRYEKGVSSKGKGRGNGLYFARKIVSKNNWLEEKQEVIDKYYIQKLSILKLEK